jgi:hypothetical protein
MAWVLYDYLKLHAPSNDPVVVIRVLKEIRKLGSIENAEMFYEQVAYWTGTFLLNHAKSRHPDGEVPEQIFQSIEDFAFPKPSVQYSWLLTGFLAHWENWTGFVGLMNWWGWKSFREEDFLPVTRDNKQYLSLVEKLIGRYTKTLLRKVEQNELPERVVSNLGHSLLQFTEEHSEQCRHYTFYAYYRAKVLFLLGKKEKAKDCFLPFAKKRMGDFWVWELLGQLEKDPDLALACQVRAVSVKTKPEFLLKVREDLVRRIIDIDPNWAKTELDRIIKLREKRDWPLSKAIKEMMAEKWFVEGKIISTNALYRQYAEQANRQFMGEATEYVLLISESDPEKGNGFGLNEKKETVKLRTGKIEIKAGQVYEILGQEGPNEWVLMQQAKKAETGKFAAWLTSKTATFRLHQGGQFGFVKNIFIPPPLVQKYALEDGMRISVKAIQSYNVKKGRWGWQACEIKLGVD